MSEELQETWKDLNHPPDGCVRCGRTVNNDEFDTGGDRVALVPSKVTWRCAGCGYLVCRDCTLTLPGWRRPTEPHGKAGHSEQPSPGGREYFHDTLCSKACWERVGRPKE